MNKQEKNSITIKDNIIQHVDCETSITFIIDKLASYGFHSANRSLKCTNVKCAVNEDSVRKISWLSLDIKNIETNGIKALNDSVLINDSQRKCKNAFCGGFNSYQYELHHHRVIIELCVIVI